MSSQQEKLRRSDTPVIPFGWGCVLAKDSKNLLRVPNILLSYFIWKYIQTTEGEFLAQPVNRSLRKPYVVRFCTIQIIFTCVIYRFLPGSDLVPACWRTHSREIYTRAVPPFCTGCKSYSPLCWPPNQACTNWRPPHIVKKWNISIFSS